MEYACPFCGNRLDPSHLRWCCPACKARNDDVPMFVTCEGCRLEPDHYSCDQCGGEIDFMLLSGFTYGEPRVLRSLEFAGIVSDAPELSQSDWGTALSVKFEHRLVLRSYYIHTVFVAENGTTWVHLFLFRREKPTVFDHANADAFMTIKVVGRGTPHPNAHIVYMHS
jgi:hypothetical protein